MRSQCAFTNKCRNTIVRMFATILAITSIGVLPQVASALEFTYYDLEEVETGVWALYGNVDVEEEETADIVFGGILAGQSSQTDFYGDFYYVFAGNYYDEFSFTGYTANDQTETTTEELSGEEE